MHTIPDKAKPEGETLETARLEPSGAGLQGPRSQMRGILLAAIVVVGIAVFIRMTQVPSEPAWYEEASQHFLKGDIAGAQRILQDGLQKDAGSVDGRELLAECELASGNDLAEMVTFRQVQAVDRTRPHIVTRLAEASMASSPSDSLEAAREAVIQEPRSPRARLLLAWNMARAGASSDALEEARAADELTGSNLVRDALEKEPGARTDATGLVRLLHALVYQAPY